LRLFKIIKWRIFVSFFILFSVQQVVTG